MSDQETGWLWPGYASGRDKELRRVYGITEAQYEALLAAQDGRCGACGRPPARGRVLVVDHDHDTREIRGLLCARCNRALSTGLARYIADPPARTVGPLFVPEGRTAAMTRRRQQRTARRAAAEPTPADDQGAGYAAKVEAALQSTAQQGETS